jgi:hypothetical protein
VAQILAALGGAGLAKVVALLALQPRGEGFTRTEAVDAAAAWLARRPDLRGKVSEAEIRQLLAAIAAQRSPAGVLGDREVRRLLLRRALEYAAERQGLAVDPAEDERAVDLIEEGVLAADLRGATRCTLRTLRRLPPALSRLLRVRSRLAEVVRGLLADVARLPASLRRLGVTRLRRLMRGDATGLDEAAHIAVLEHTLAAILAEDLPPDVARDWLVGLLDYDSVRLAIVLYARIALNLNIAAADLDALQASLRNNDLTPLVMGLVTQARH